MRETCEKLVRLEGIICEDLADYLGNTEYSCEIPASLWCRFRQRHDTSPSPLAQLGSKGETVIGDRTESRYN